jgi:AsmA protein
VQGPLQIARFNPKQLLKALWQEAPATADPQALTGLALQARLGATPGSVKLDDLRIQLDQSSASGTLSVRDFASQAVQFALKVDQFDTDRYLPPKSATKTPADGEAGPRTPINELPLPNAVLDALNVEGTLDIAQLKLSGLTLSDARVRLAGGKGEVKRQEIAARLYGGSITLNNRFTPGQRNTGSYALSTELKALEAAGFLRDLLGRDYVSGLANVRLDLSGSGATVGDLRRALGGEAGFKVENGAIKGFNLGQSLRKAQAALAGNLNYSEDAPRQTEFGNLSGSARIAQGVLRTETLTGANPQFRLSGSGEIDLFKETINFLAKPTVLDTGSTGGNGLEPLRGLAIPIQLTGNLFDPKVRINLQDALKAQARDAAGARLDSEKEKVKDQVREKIEEKIGPGVSDLFRGLRKKPQPEPAAEPAPKQDGTGSS